MKESYFLTPKIEKSGFFCFYINLVIKNTLSFIKMVITRCIIETNNLDELKNIHPSHFFKCKYI